MFDRVNSSICRDVWALLTARGARLATWTSRSARSKPSASTARSAGPRRRRWLRTHWTSPARPELQLEHDLAQLRAGLEARVSVRDGLERELRRHRDDQIAGGEAGQHRSLDAPRRVGLLLEGARPQDRAVDPRA